MWGCPTFFPFHGGGFSFGGGFVWLILIVALILGIRAVWSPRRPPADQHRNNARADRDDALRILRIRLAEGAITEEEFERLRRAVES